MFFLINHCLAANAPGAFTLTLSDAYYNFSSSRHLENTSMPNAALSYNFNDRWAVEGGVGVINTNKRITEQGVHGLLYTLDGLYRFTAHHRFQPYVLAGIGMLAYKPSGNEPEHAGNINAGLGTQYFSDGPVALRLEFRDLYTISGGKNDWLVNLGVSFLLGCV